MNDCHLNVSPVTILILTSAYMTMLDAKSAFDVVVKDILVRKTFFSEVEPAA